MSYREPFYIFPRKMKSGKTIFYYQTYLPSGKLSYARSTGQTTKGAAKAFCRALEKEERLVPEGKNESMIFSTYFVNWWEWGPDASQPSLCPYLTRKFLRGQKPSYAHSRVTRNKYKRHVLPYYKDMDIRKIKTKDVEKWLDGLALTGLSGKSQVDLLSILRIMLREAKRLGDIKTNPVLDVIPPLKSKPKKRGILTPEETEKLFCLDQKDEVWSGDYQAMAAFMLARDTAMRPGEIRALQRKHIHFSNKGECQIDIVQAVDHASHRIKETKTGAVLTGVPVRSDTAGVLLHLCQEFDDADDLIFSKDGQIHVSDHYLQRRLYKALRVIGISEEKRRERNLTQYSFRNQAITRLRQQGISDVAVRSLARHTTPIMTDGYTLFNDGESIGQIRDFYKDQDQAAGGF